MNLHIDKHPVNIIQEMHDYMLTDSVQIEQMNASNEVSLRDGQVEHGWEHALDVHRLVRDILLIVKKLFPEVFAYNRPWASLAHDWPVIEEMLFELWMYSALVSALRHDSGRGIEVKDHEKHGAVLTHMYLRELAIRMYGTETALPEAFRRRVVGNVVKHRSPSWLYKNDQEKAQRRKEIDGPDIAALLLADKLCGSETRVPEAKMDFMLRLAAIKIPRKFRKKFRLDRHWSLARINWGNPDLIEETPNLLSACRQLLADNGIVFPPDMEIDAHDRVNGSIKNPRIEIVADDPSEGHSGKVRGTLLYRVDVNERLAPRELVTGLDWWEDAFHVAAKAAKYLGCRFRIVFNEHTLVYDRQVNSWVQASSMHA